MFLLNATCNKWYRLRISDWSTVIKQFCHKTSKMNISKVLLQKGYYTIQTICFLRNINLIIFIQLLFFFKIGVLRIYSIIIINITQSQFIYLKIPQKWTNLNGFLINICFNRKDNMFVAWIQIHFNQNIGSRVDRHFVWCYCVCWNLSIRIWDK